MIEWGPEVTGLMDDARLLVQQAADDAGSPLVSLLIEGAPNSGTVIGILFIRIY